MLSVLIKHPLLCPQDLSDLDLVRWTNGKPEPSTSKNVDLSVADVPLLPAGGFLIICRSKNAFEATFSGVTCDIEAGPNSPADSNGDDQIAIVVRSSGAIVDIFGVPGEDGTNTGHDFEDGRVLM